jgi:DNA-directed RNA polymerase specialized sigma24 family protein
MAKWPRFDPDADRRLVSSLSGGTEEPLAALYDIYAERLRDYCGSLIRDRRVATDIIHDTLIDASRRVRRMRDRVRLRAWLYAAVRRRCLQRVRHPALRWDYGGGDAIDEEARELLEAALDRLDFVDQEALLLALRHDLDGDDLGALLGIPARRAAARIARAEARAETALSNAQRALAKRCATGDLTATETETETEPATEPETGPVAGADGEDADQAEPRAPATRGSSARLRLRPMSDAAIAEHVAGCADCRRRRDLSLAALLDLLPAPKLPASLRHRVVHTGTDPELAGYRADIAARGGTLNADGLPRQPDIPSHFARRWLFTSGGMAGALVTAVIAALLIGPGTPIPDLIWPSVGPEPSDTARVPSRRPPVQAQPPSTGSPAWPRDAVPQAGPGAAEKKSPVPAATGKLEVTPTAVTFGPQQTVAEVTLAATGGPVTWQAVSSTNRIALSANDGRLARGDKSVVTLTFRRGQLLELPGRETVIFTDSNGRDHTVSVTWAGSLL